MYSTCMLLIIIIYYGFDFVITEKRLRDFETEQKVTRRYLNALRKRQYSE